MAKYLIEEEDAGRALSRRDLRDMAQEIIDPRCEDTCVGQHWPSRFLRRNRDVKMKNTIPIEATRTNEATPERIRRFFIALAQEIDKKAVPPERIYNIDEHSLTEGKTKAGKVIGNSLTRRAIVAESDNRTWVLVIEAVSAVGRRLKPVVIFSGINLQEQWFPETIPDWGFDCSATGWANARICEKWLREVFHPLTKPSRSDLWRILVLDGFTGHISPRFRYRAAFHRIQLIYLQPHSSHLTQPLDVGVFGPLKRAFEYHARKYATFNATSAISKQRFITIYKIASEEAMTERNIRGGFSGSGIWPVDAEKPLANVVIPERLPQAVSPPRTPKRRSSRPDTILNTPKNKTQLASQLNLLQRDPEHIDHNINIISQRTGDKLERLQVELAEWKAKYTHLEASTVSQKVTKRKTIEYDPVGGFPTIEEIKGLKNKKGSTKKRKTATTQPQVEEATKEISTLIWNNLARSIQE